MAYPNDNTVATAVFEIFQDVAKPGQDAMRLMASLKDPESVGLVMQFIRTYLDDCLKGSDRTAQADMIAETVSRAVSPEEENNPVITSERVQSVLEKHLYHN